MNGKEELQNDLRHGIDLVDFFVERELARPFTSFVVGISIDVDGE